jgi:hypothetical protein
MGEPSPGDLDATQGLGKGEKVEGEKVEGDKEKGDDGETERPNEADFVEVIAVPDSDDDEKEEEEEEAAAANKR